MVDPAAGPIPRKRGWGSGSRVESAPRSESRLQGVTPPLSLATDGSRPEQFAPVKEASSARVEKLHVKSSPYDGRGNLVSSLATNPEPSGSMRFYINRTVNGLREGWSLSFLV